MVLKARLGTRNQLFNNNNVYLTTAIISLIFVSVASINAAGVSSGQVDNVTNRTSSGSLSNTTTITTYSSSVYLIPSTSAQLNTFSTNYAIAGTIPSLNNSKDLITSTIIDDFDKNPNIGYIVKSSSSQTSSTVPSPSATQSSLPNPFVGQNLINQKITNEIQDVIAASATSSSSTNSTKQYVEIKCTFGMILDDYKCS
jgi:hypothetical protein